MDLVTGLPTSRNGCNAIFSVVDRFSKWVTFIPCKKTDGSVELARLFISEVVSKHGIPKILISDRD